MPVNHGPVFHAVYTTRTPHQDGTQVRFWIPIKIPAEYVSLMPRLPKNAKMKILYRVGHGASGRTVGLG